MRKLTRLDGTVVERETDTPRIPKGMLTAKGFVCIVHVEDSGLVNICTHEELGDIIQEMRIGFPFTVTVMRQIEVNDVLRLEKELHARYVQYRCRGRWFALPRVELESLVNENFTYWPHQDIYNQGFIAGLLAADSLGDEGPPDEYGRRTWLPKKG